MKPQEKQLLVMIADKPAGSVINRSGIPHKRCWYYLRKWMSKQWYSFGVCLDLGWLTDEGIGEAKR